MLQCFCNCILDLFENTLQYLTRNAYIMTAITGQPFCTAAKSAYQLIVENALRVLTICSVAQIVLTMSSLLVVLLTVAFSYLMLDSRGVETLCGLLLVVGCLAFFLSSIFMTVLDMIFDTLFLCFMLDCKHHDGSSNLPYYMPVELMEFIKSSENFLAKEEEKENR